MNRKYRITREDAEIEPVGFRLVSEMGYRTLSSSSSSLFGPRWSPMSKLPAWR